MTVTAPVDEGTPARRRVGDERLPAPVLVLAIAAICFFAVPFLGLLWKVPWGDVWSILTSHRSLVALRLSLWCSFWAALFAIVFGIGTGVVAAWRRGTAADKGALWGGLGFYSMPPQWLGLVIVLFIAGWLGLPTSGVKDPTLGILDDPGAIEVVVDRLEHMILPALTLGLVIFGENTLIVRSAMLETLGEDYILTSRAKGLTNWSTVWKHGFRNAMLPVITLVALSLGFIIGGAITVEYVFSYPGIGLLIVEAIDQRDYPVLQAAFLLLTLSVIFFNLLADLLYFKYDPRVTE